MTVGVMDAKSPIRILLSSPRSFRDIFTVDLYRLWCVSEENIALNGRSTKWSAVHKFLVSAGVGEYVNKFVEQRVDLDALFMLDDRDLISLGLPLGPRKKLLGAIDERARRCAHENIGVCPDAMSPAKSLNEC